MFWLKICATALFYLQDAGETNGLLPVIREMERQGIPYEVWAGGTAAHLLEGVPFKQLAIDRSWPRQATLPAEELARWIAPSQPSVFVTGVAFALQGQLLDAFRDKGVRTFAFWDNLNESGADSYFSTAQQVVPHADWVFTPSSHFSFAHHIAVGQPAIEAMQEAIEALDREAIRRRLGVEGQTLVYFGGYGAAFEEGYRLFLECVEQFDGTVLVQPHPKTGPAGLLDPRVRVLQGEVTTQEAIAAADAVLCHQSTTSFLALAAGKPVLYIIPAEQRYDNLALQADLAARVSHPAEFAPCLERASRPGAFFERLDLPQGSARRIVELLTESKE